MFKLNDEVRIIKTTSENFGETGTIKDETATSGGYRLVHVNGVGLRYYDPLDLELIPVAPPVLEYEKVISQVYVVITDHESVEFGDSELEAAHFAIRELRAGRSAEIYERVTTESYRRIDAL